MSNDWISRLVVRGPAEAVAAFAKAATEPRILEDQLAEKPTGRRPLGLSFHALLRSLPLRRVRRLEPNLTEPWDLSVDPLVRFSSRLVERTYRFQLAGYEPDALLREVSRQYPLLCFVLGWVDPSTDDQASRLMHRGRSILYRLPEKRKKLLLADVPKEGTADDDEVFSALIQADWAMMDAVIDHWDRKMRSVL